MVNVVQTSVKTSASDLLPVKSQVSTAEDSHSPSFGEILQVNRRKEQQALEKTAVQAAAAQAAIMQSKPAENPSVQAESQSDSSSSAAGKISEVRSSASPADVSSTSSSLKNDNAAAKSETQSMKSAAAAGETQSFLDTGTQAGDSSTETTHVTSSLSGGVIHGNDGDVQMFSEQLSRASEQQAQEQASQVSASLTGADANSSGSSASVQAEAAALQQASAQSADTVTSSLSQEKVVSAGAAADRSAANKLASSGKNDQQVKEEAKGTGLPVHASVSGSNDQGAAIVEPVSTLQSVRTSTENLRSFFASQETQKTSASGTKVDTAQAFQFQNPVTTMVEPVAVSKAAASTISTLDQTALSLDIVQQVMQQMSATLKSGPSSMHLQLNPRELGAIDVQMVKSSQGMSVTFAAEHASTGRLLETQIGQLRQSLTDSGVKLSELNISQQGFSSQQGSTSRQQNQFDKQPAWRDVIPSRPEQMAAEIKVEQVSRKLQGVDYLV